MKFPKNEARALSAWMREQMYGDVPTIWSYGNENDRMAEALDLIESLLEREGGR